MKQLIKDDKYPANVIAAVFGEKAKSAAFYFDPAEVESKIDDVMHSVFTAEDCEAFYSFYKNGVPKKEIASKLDCSIETVDYILSRILRKLRHPCLSRRLKNFTDYVVLFPDDCNKIPSEITSCIEDNQTVAVTENGKIKAFVISKEEYDALHEKVKLTVEREQEEKLAADTAETELLKRAVLLAIENRTISTATLQQELSIGYAHAARLMDEMEQHKYISPYVPLGTARKVYITREQYDELFGE